MIIKYKQMKIPVVIITMILLIVLVSQIKLADIINTLVSINRWYILFGFVLFSLNSFFKTIKFYLLLNQEIALRKLFNIVYIHNMVNNIMPARTGE